VLIVEKIKNEHPIGTCVLKFRYIHWSFYLKYVYLVDTYRSSCDNAKINSTLWLVASYARTKLFVAMLAHGNARIGKHINPSLCFCQLYSNL
jgi:hypothetical protein